MADMAVEYINMINKMVAGGKTELRASFRQIFRKMIALKRR